MKEDIQLLDVAGNCRIRLCSCVIKEILGHFQDFHYLDYMPGRQFQITFDTNIVKNRFLLVSRKNYGKIKQYMFLIVIMNPLFIFL